MAKKEPVFCGATIYDAAKCEKLQAFHARFRRHIARFARTFEVLCKKIRKKGSRPGCPGHEVRIVAPNGARRWQNTRFRARLKRKWWLRFGMLFFCCSEVLCFARRKRKMCYLSAGIVVIVVVVRSRRHHRTVVIGNVAAPVHRIVKYSLGSNKRSKRNETTKFMHASWLCWRQLSLWRITFDGQSVLTHVHTTI